MTFVVDYTDAICLWRCPTELLAIRQLYGALATSKLRQMASELLRVDPINHLLMTLLNILLAGVCP